MKALVGAFNQEKALVGAFSVIVQLHRLIVYSTCPPAAGPGLHRVRGGVGADEVVQPLGPGEAEEGEQPRHRQLGAEAQVLEPHQVDSAGEPGTQLLQISSLVSI